MYRRFLDGCSAAAAAAAAAAALAARTALVVPGGRPRRRGAGEGDAMGVYIVLYVYLSLAQDGRRAARIGADRGRESVEMARRASFVTRGW